MDFVKFVGQKVQQEPFIDLLAVRLKTADPLVQESPSIVPDQQLEVAVHAKEQIAVLDYELGVEVTIVVDSGEGCVDVSTADERQTSASLIELRRGKRET